MDAETYFYFVHAVEIGSIPGEVHFGGFGFHAFGSDVVSGDAEVVRVDEFDLGAPAPIGSASGVRVTAEDKEAFFGGVARAEHDGGVVVETIHPTGFELLEGGVVTKGEHAVLDFSLYGTLIQIQRKAAIEQKLDRPDDGRFVRQFVGFQPEFGGAAPVARELGEVVVGGVGNAKFHLVSLGFISYASQSENAELC